MERNLITGYRMVLIMDPCPNKVVYVQLLDEGTVVYRPAPAEFLEWNLVKLSIHEAYDPEDEEWEFKPGILVRVESKALQEGTVLVAVELFKDANSKEE